MSILHLDLETRSTVDLKKTGVHVYAGHPSTDVWCAAYAFDDEPVELWIPGQPCPPRIAAHVLAGGEVHAWNAAFERIIWKHILSPRHGWPEPTIVQWRCVMVAALAMSLPGALSNAAGASGIDIGKDMDGKSLMLRMARPRGHDASGEPVWWDVEERKQRLYAYCKTDVEVERQIGKRLLSLRPSEQRLWHLDQEINDRGVHVDEALCLAAKKIVKETTDRLDAEMSAVTDFDVPACSNVSRLAAWVRSRGVPTEALAKGDIDDLLAGELPCDVRRALELRQEAGKASVAKIDTLLAGTGSDGRARGLLQFNAASTGRWAGRRFQPQNLKRPELGGEDLRLALRAVRTGRVAVVDALFGRPLSVVGDCLRGMIRAEPGKRLISADYANIEGRVLAWEAGEDWKLDAFRAFDAGTGPDLYKLSYGRAFGIDPNDVDKSQRQIGKVMELALGYQGGIGAFQKMASGYGVTVSDEDADALKNRWRDAHPKIVRMWFDAEAAALEALERPGAVVTFDRFAFRKSGSFLFLRLPSGRALSYPYPKIVDCVWLKRETREVGAGGEITISTENKRAPLYEVKEGRWRGWRQTGKAPPQFIYKGVDPYTRKWGWCKAYGGKTVENGTQAVARDVLADAMPRLEAAGYPIVLTVHDEIVSEVPVGFGSVDEFCEIMCDLPPWAEGLPITAEGWEGSEYRK